MILATIIFAAALTDRTIVTVDQEGEINKPNVVAKAADMAANQVKADIALAKAEAAADSAGKATNALHEVVRQIGENELVLYRQGFTDSLGVAVVLPKDTKMRVSMFKSNTGIRASDGYIQHTIRYATTENADAVTADVKVASPLVAVKDFAKLPALDVEPKVRISEPYEYGGETYPYQYEVKFYTPPDNQGFAIVYLDADDAETDGALFVIDGGIAGGLTTERTVGNTVFGFTGGLLTEVDDVE
ncbi:MAG: hypothetical protein E7046_00870 [Lentisphaerae bacterium]|nr:hypothetical protein [Lentisphaerota bacterium]